MTLIFESIKVKFCLISYKRSAKIIDGGEERQLAFKLQNLRFFEKRSKVTTCGKPIFYIEIAMFQVAFLVIKTDAVEWFFL